MGDMEDMGGSWVRTGVHACLPISAAAAVSRDVREIDVNNLVDILDVIRTIMYHILHYPGDHRFWRRGEDRGGQEGLQVSHSRFPHQITPEQKHVDIASHIIPKVVAIRPAQRRVDTRMLRHRFRPPLGDEKPRAVFECVGLG